MLPRKFVPSFATCLAYVLSLCFLIGCTTSGGQRWAERAKLCDQPRQHVPDWPAELADFPAYALELLGVIESDRAVTRIERECRADL